MAVNYCANCGKEIMQVNEKFCSNCGQKLSDSESDSFSTVHLSKLPSFLINAVKNKKVLVGIYVVIASLFILFLVNSTSQTPSDVAEDFIKKTQEQDYEAAQELWSQSGIDYMLSQLGDERWINQNMKNFTHRTDGNLSEFKITGEEKLEDDKAKVFADFTFDNGRREKATLAMIKEDGKWKVFAFGTY